jgi:hypothetical protein
LDVEQTIHQAIIHRFVCDPITGSTRKRDPTWLKITILSSAHLRDAVEGVSNYGKPTRRKGQPTVGNQPGSENIPNGTGTGIGNEPVKEEKNVA